MYRQRRVVRTKLTPPRLQKHTLYRPRVTEQLLAARDYRLTIVRAGTGYGKSTALASLADADYPLAWYHLSGEDVDPVVFLLHLLYSFDVALPDLSESAVATLEGWEGDTTSLPWKAVVDQLVNELAGRSEEAIFLVVDDAHLLDAAPDAVRTLDRFVGRAPANVHAILSTRYPPDLPGLVGWRIKGDVLEITQRELAFTTEEALSLFRDQYRVFVTPDEIEMLTERTEGWAIALQLAWQGLRSGVVDTLPEALERLSGGEDDLFTYLGQEVLAQQPPDVQAFLLDTVVLREMTPSICDCLRGADDSARMLAYLLKSGLFVVDLGDGHLRYHHLFRDFLRHQVSADDRRRGHREAADCCRLAGELEEAIYHLLEGEAFEEAAALLEEMGRELVRAGRLDRLAEWLRRLPPTALEHRPSLLVHLGDIARLHSRFEEALGWYRQAERRSRARDSAGDVGRALRGQARVYLDTVNPSQAVHLLQEALRLSDGQEDRATRARLLDLMAENRLNLGHPEEAEHFRALARELREEGPGKAELATRVLLRTGQLDRARRMLEDRLEREEENPVRRPRAHRETLLLLSLILAFQGEGEKAFRFATRGITRGKDLNSPYVTAVGLMRQGHAWLLRDGAPRYEEACRNYREAIELSDSLAVPRLKVEACWGLCRAHGFEGEIALARDAATEGVGIAQEAGDEWIAALIRLSLAAGCALAGDQKGALSRLSVALTAFRECGDTFGQAVTRLWQCLTWHEMGDAARLERGVADLLRLVREHNYAYLFLHRTLLGPPDPRRTVPVLLFARDAGVEATCAEAVLADLELSGLETHPGYQLRIQTLGPFCVWRGAEEIDVGDWPREKARHLFQFLLTHRGCSLDRDQIVEAMWPGLDVETGRRDFKVALSTLRHVLQPELEAGAASAYVARDGSIYGLRPEADIDVDADRFEALVGEGDRVYKEDPDRALEVYERAMTVYQDDYLLECIYEDWCSAERERLLTLYLRTADRLARGYIERQAWEEVIPICRAMLARDDCWEQAYRSMMIAYAEMGYRVQAVRTYKQCEERLRTALDIEPSEATLGIYESIC